MKKLRHAAALALVVWYLIQAPVRPCVGPADPGLSYDYLNRRADQCFDLGASLTQWSSGGDFASEDECWVAIFPQLHTHLPVPRAPQLMCISSDDPRLAK